MAVRSAQERVLQTLCFEAGGVAVAAPAHQALFGSTAAESIGLMVALALAVALWAPLHNALFDLAEWRLARRVASDRPHGLRALHAVSHEVSSMVVSLPVLMLVGGHALWEAVALDLGLSAFYAVYAYLFHLAYDRLRPVRAAASPARDSDPALRASTGRGTEGPTARGAPAMDDVRRLSALAICLALGCALAACGSGIRQSVGLEAPPPDEFLVVARRPIEMPPRLDALPPPRPGAPSRTDPDPAGAAQAALGGAAAGGATAAAPSAGEQALLTALAPPPTEGGAPADIRAQLAAERTAPERRFGLDSLFGVPIVQDPQTDAERLRAEEEAARLREAGKPAPIVTTPAP